MSDPLTTWLEKKLYLEQQLAITSDASQKFALREQIKECEQEIARLQAASSQTTKHNYFNYFIKEIRTKYKELSLLNIPTDIQPLIKKFDFFGIEWSTSFGFTIAVVKADNLTKEQIKLLFETFITINDFLYKNPKVLDISYLVWLVAFTLSGTLCFIFENQLSQEIREFIQNQQKASAAYDKGLSSFFWVQSTSTSLGWVVSLKNGQIDSSLGKTPDGSNYHAINTIKHLEKLERTIKEICQISTNSNATPPSSPNPNQNSNSSTTTNSNQTNSNLSHILEVHKQEIIEDIASAYKQLGMVLSEVDKVRIQRQIKNLEQELKDVEDKLNKAKN